MTRALTLLRLELLERLERVLLVLDDGRDPGDGQAGLPAFLGDAERALAGELDGEAVAADGDEAEPDLGDVSHGRSSFFLSVIGVRARACGVKCLSRMQRVEGRRAADRGPSRRRPSGPICSRTRAVSTASAGGPAPGERPVAGDEDGRDARAGRGPAKRSTMTRPVFRSYSRGDLGFDEEPGQRARGRGTGRRGSSRGRGSPGGPGRTSSRRRCGRGRRRRSPGRPCRARRGSACPRTG